MHIYKNEAVESVESFYGELLVEIRHFSSISAHLNAIAERMWEGVQRKDPRLYHQIGNHHPVFLGSAAGELENSPLTFVDCQTTIAREYGFNDWEDLKTQLDGMAYDLSFEAAVNDLVNGNIDAFKARIHDDPDLIKKRSRYGHGATLLHYTASNGVALWRQKVPYNLPEITAYLLESGADVTAKMKVYGGTYDTLVLLTTSAHPFAAGIGEVMVELLERYS